MPLPSSSIYESIFKGTRKDNENDFGLQNETDVASDISQRHSRNPSADLEVMEEPMPTVGKPVNIKEDATEIPPAKRLKFQTNNAITVYVGNEKAAFTIHRGPICDASAFFKGLFDNSFRETSEKVVTLEYHTPETFDQFLGFAYSRFLDRTPFLGLGQEEQWMAYGRLYVLADYLQASSLQSTIAGILFAQVAGARCEKTSACITAQVIDYVYSNTVRQCGIRKLIVAQHIWGSDHEPFRNADDLKDLDTFLEDLHEDFVAELAAESMRRVWDKKTRDPFKGSSAQFFDTEKSDKYKQITESGL